MINNLNRGLTGKVTPDQLAAADAVLRAVLADEHTRALAAYLSRPGQNPGQNPAT